jgi:hypothetical protein
VLLGFGPIASSPIAALGGAGGDFDIWTPRDDGQDSWVPRADVVDVWTPRLDVSDIWTPKKD